MLYLTRPDAITRLGVLQPVGGPGWDPTADAFQVAQAFANVGNYAYEPSPEGMARQAQNVAAGILMGIGFGPYGNTAVLQAARLLATGQAARITSQGRTVEVQPLSQTMGRYR